MLINDIIVGSSSWGHVKSRRGLKEDQEVHSDFRQPPCGGGLQTLAQDVRHDVHAVCIPAEKCIQQQPKACVRGNAKYLGCALWGDTSGYHAFDLSLSIGKSPFPIIIDVAD